MEKKKRVINRSTILETSLITPNLRRILVDISKFEHIDLKDRGGYIKLSVLNEEGEEVLRSISVSTVDTEKKTMSLDFVHHGGLGPGAKFAREAKVGGEISFYGPGPRRDVEQSLEEFIFIGDMTAFPAIKVQLELMIENDIKSPVEVILEAKSSEDFEYFEHLTHRENFNFKFIEGNFTALELLNGFKEMALSSEKSKSLWCAGERLAINEVRTYLKDHPQISFIDKYTSSYWQCGLTQNEHSQLKKTDIS
ncbi:siderophore-interacting protein [Halobacteriovorax sp. JY17]|uniref:siderophore-interacting protein n=1 Tax=Halobacteriovorax sp. JY17 TaxID=2014617 RepID=UPI000C3CC8C0|nr:siderophore-interacting protein [Halobacteriovorax sp. JY17]PIK15082.1 MAG: hypothetical protein CES88_12160 [Halobacteriovorax sp. JY17]